MRDRALALILALALAVPGASQTAIADAEVRRGIAQVDEGEYDAAILTLDGAVRRLAAEKGHSSNDLAEAYFYLGVAYLGKGHETSAKARFRDAVQQMREMSPSPEKFPPRVIELFEKAREESRAGAPASTPAAATAPPEKKKGGKGLLIAGGVVLVGGGVALAAGGSGDSGSDLEPPPSAQAQTRTESSSVPDGTEQGFTFTSSGVGTADITITWQDRNVGLSIICQEQNPPYTPCSGSYNRTTDTSGRFTTAVTQKEYLVSVANYSGRGGAEPFTITLRYP